MILSILICTIPKRKDLFDRLYTELLSQKLACGADIEILSDPKDGTIGAKRQRLLERAQGDYVVFIDDDDEVFPYYVEEILKAAEAAPDCIGIKGYMTTDGNNKIGFELSKDFNNETIRIKKNPFYLRKTNHIAPVKRELALQVGFPDKSNAEDKCYSDRLNPLLKTECKIIPVMYHYRFSRFNKTYQ